MAYCTIGYINSMAVHLDINTTSDPTTAEVETIIADIDAEMDQRFKAAGVAVPITDATLLKIVKPISAHGTLARVYRSMEMEPETAETFQGLFDRAIASIDKRPAILSTGTTESATPTGSMRRDDGDPTFERGVKQW